MRQAQRDDQQGSALVMAIFVMALLSLLGVGLLGLTELNLKMNKASLNTKRAFYLAETGIENGRRALFDTAGGSDIFGPSLDSAAGHDGRIDFDPYQIQVQYDSDGNIAGFVGYGDDQPLFATTRLGSGVYAAFLTNDPIDGRTNPTDTNSRVMITGIGVGPDQSFKIVESIIEPEVILPRLPASVVTLIGSDPSFDGGPSNAERYRGEDCHFLGGGIPHLNVPIVGTTSSSAESLAETGMAGAEAKYASGTYTGIDTGVDLLNGSDPLVSGTGLGTLDSAWTNCGILQSLLKKLDDHATHYCDMSVACVLPTTMAPDDILFIDGDIQLGPGFAGSGVLVVTGELEFLGTSTFTGVVLVVGEGQLRRTGGGNGTISGTTLVANIAGPNGVYGDSDDCQPVPVPGQPSDVDLFGPATYEVIGGGNADIDYCSRFTANGTRSYRVVDFRQL